MPQDFSKAFELYQKAAEQGDARAQNNLGSLYSAGQGVALDEKTAAKWFRKSAEQGIPLAQANLALLLLRGAGVEQNTAEALR
ncbi:MAG: tetratricopeptide repeat protein [Chthoniobacterales bacterium]